jgi:asparagine synthase (glutamine-hydrolysing)
MIQKTTSIIPSHAQYAKNNQAHELHKEAICLFMATGFFLDRDTFWKDVVALPPASHNECDKEGKLVSSKPYFNWYYSPRKISFEEALEEFTLLFETIIEEQVGDRKVILPLSGGLDSRTQATALKYLGKKVTTYSYDFDGGYPETKIAEAIASICSFEFHRYTVPKGYLWSQIEQLARINGCFSEFTHPRQMAFLQEYASLGEVFSLGHWGDVLFDRGVPQGTQEADIPKYLLKKIVKKGGMELGRALWRGWNLEGDFETYLTERITTLWQNIAIDDLSARMRAFKSLYWAPRWTSTNLAIFSEARPITLPYYDNRMCDFICTIPEEYLADRKLQIAYIKKRNPSLAKITWQDHRPFHLYNFHWNRSPYNLPFRTQKKIEREIQKLMGKPYIQRNWELQFLGVTNDLKLRSYLFESNLKEWVPEEVIESFYYKFKRENQVTYSHPVSMLLTLALKSKMDGIA